MKKLDETIIKSINEVFEEVFGNVFMTAVRDYLAERGLDLDDPCLDIEKFHEALVSLFGEGAEALEKAIVDDLHRKLGLSEPKLSGFVEAIKKLKGKQR